MEFRVATPFSNDLLDRAWGALVGGALGDALGMPTQLLSSTDIEKHYGRVRDFVAPFAGHPVSHGLPAGSITDDTEQTLLLGRVLLERPDGFDQRRWVSMLENWEREVHRRGGLDLLGPSTRRAIEAVRSGIAIEQAGRFGDTNGAAMRIAPVGIVMAAEPLDDLIAKVWETCRATHNTSVAIAAAAAVAAAVSSAIDGGDWRAACDHGVTAAERARRLGHWVVGADIATRIAWARDLVRGLGEADGKRRVIDLIGTSVAAQESVPAAFAVLEIARGDPWQAAVIGANLGGDTDTIGAIATSIAGAARGYAGLPHDKVEALRGFDPSLAKRLAAELLALRFPWQSTIDDLEAVM